MTMMMMTERCDRRVMIRLIPRIYKDGGVNLNAVYIIIYLFFIESCYLQLDIFNREMEEKSGYGGLILENISQRNGICCKRSQVEKKSGKGIRREGEGEGRPWIGVWLTFSLSPFFPSLSLPLPPTPFRPPHLSVLVTLPPFTSPSSSVYFPPSPYPLSPFPQYHPNCSGCDYLENYICIYNIYMWCIYILYIWNKNNMQDSYVYI